MTVIRLKEIYICDFCGKDSDEVQLMITGPKKVAICDECTVVCGETLVEHLEKKAAAARCGTTEPE